ncbi:DDE-type integrase/transposase/recombinase [Shewanella eurypsychrophilus]|uniref:DDE-type integrase/transposase/recombinase n=1 Tax=Shewanella eurypsychrophilus TaxID=2593656 RepID=A0ABX6VAR9_9GAMM|nr:MULTISPECIES: DDE-type integrase/transposase/recombinase [Shewanella]QFU23763.1 DDE-type integrase/transposase/recombinase [Shewanella sp. YLB-09]QPG58986.1 DDE-type integrase/transposase/recombinase [Shewanella eurypsychrophilus]
MTINTPLNLNLQESYRQLAQQLDAAPHGERGALRQAFEKMHGVSSQTVYRQLKQVGWETTRKTRSDAGSTSIDEQTLQEIEAVTRLSQRANGKHTMPTTVAVSMLAGSGREINLSNSRLNQLRRQRKSTAKHQKQASPHQQLRSLFANHVHQVDPSYCLLYYAPCGGQKVQKFVDESDMYANKPENMEKVSNLKCWRYVLTDHYSGSIMVRYYQSKGETSANLWDFLLYCWQSLDSRPFRGVPDIMVWDKGSANTSGAIKNALDALKIEHIAHMAKNPRAKGQVESSNNIVECHFESRLKFEPVNSVEELNQAAEAWYNAWNANLLPRQDSRLRRRGMTQPIARYELWQTILRTPEKLRELPPIEMCRYLLKAEPKPKKVQGNLDISFKHPAAPRSQQYSLKGLAHVVIGEKVAVAPLYYGDCQIMVTISDCLGEEYKHVLEPKEFDQAGFAIDAPVWGEEIIGMADTEVETRNKASDRTAFPDMDLEQIKKAKAKQVTPFEGKLNAHSHLKEIEQPTFMRREGSNIELTEQYQPAQRKPLSRIALKRLVLAALGRPLSIDESQELEQYQDVFDEDIPQIMASLLQPVSPLKLVK